MNRLPEAQGMQLPSLRGRGDTRIRVLHGEPGFILTIGVNLSNILQ